MKPSYDFSFGQGESSVSGIGVISSGNAGGIESAGVGDSRGDIIITSSGGGNGGKRRWPIVVVILLLIVAVGVGVGALMLGNMNGGEGGDEAINEKNAFEEYNNYLIEKNNSGFDEESLGVLEKLYSSFLEKTDIDMSEYDKYFDLFVVFSRYSLPTRDDLFKKYFTDGAQSASEYLDTIIKRYESYTDIYGYNYYDLVSSWSRIILNLAELYNNAGCLNNEGADYDCIVATFTTENKQLVNDISIVDVRMSTIQDGVKRYLLTEALSIMDRLEGEQDDSE